jgi:hypothetical protein
MLWSPVSSTSLGTKNNALLVVSLSSQHAFLLYHANTRARSHCSPISDSSDNLRLRNKLPDILGWLSTESNDVESNIRKLESK